MNSFRLMLEAANNNVIIKQAGLYSFEQMMKKSIELNNQNLNLNFKELFIPITNDDIFKKYNIILESVSYSAKLIGNILNLPEKTFCPEQLSAENLFLATNKTFQTKYSIKQNILIYCIKYNFETETRYIINLFKSFQITFDNDYLHAETILKSFKNSQGMVFPNTNCIFLLLNTTSFTIDTICHELYHCLQIICDIPINTLPSLTSKQLINIPELNLTIQDLKYYLNPKQLQTYIQIDFINQCKNIFNEYYKTKTTYNSFIINILKQIKENPFMVHSNTFANILKYKQNIINRDLTPITIIAACFILNNKSYLEEIAKIIYDELNLNF